MKLGVIQMPMAWTTAENCQAICGYIHQYSTLDALIFPELSLSGFHRDIRSQCASSLIKPALQEVADACRSAGVMAFIGAPIFEHSSGYNSYLAISAQGEVLIQWDKVGLTPSEASFFSAGTDRSPLAYQDQYIGAFLCREAEDVSWFVQQSQGVNFHFVLWPAYIGSQDNDVNHRYFQGAVSIAQQLKTWVIQCNWPESLNDPSITGLGGSKVIAPDGRLILQMPVDEAAVAILDCKTERVQIISTQ
ncbi:carbon-nitrogen hydrolase family protein (plasmid) [Photobacterium sp. GJ3]|uniref:carbon-nitrogen hydrolase family protein n=1 Tax=Photobacterium sp. GJ3 TaxID=2829502 RepID=UPI001B8B9C31|nr:carbon-nitrogen hydrolase family protein [Photobacterium sp. GJ3]QUJ69934.1 carbon-nitrogen hydrolase family protein [Photobacterium sp. GJ3]